MQTKGPIKRILLYVDGSEECIAAAQFGIALARSIGAEIRAIYVVNVTLLKELTKARIFVKIEQMDYEQDLEQDGERYLNYVAKLGRAKGIEIKTELIKGVVNKEVVHKIDEWDVDLLIMGELDPILSRTNTYHDEAELVIRKAKCSVLIVKNAEKVEQIYNAIEVT